MNNEFGFHWVHSGIEKRKAGVYGYGLFAKQAIESGDRLLIYGGYILTVKQESLLEENLRDNGVQIEKDFVICSTQVPEVGGVNLLNHSCNPNAGFRGQIVIVAMRPIADGEQITIDYATALYRTNDGPPYEMNCLCGEDSCRGRITDCDWQIEELRVKYRGYFQPFLQEAIDLPPPPHPRHFDFKAYERLAYSILDTSLTTSNYFPPVLAFLTLNALL